VAATSEAEVLECELLGHVRATVIEGGVSHDARCRAS
jgi:hypothetical protein